VTKAMNALAAKQTEAKVFQRSGWLMRPLIEPAIAAPVNGMPRTTHTAAMINLTDGYLELLLRRHMDWRRLTAKGKVIETGPGSTPRLILDARGDWPFPVLNGLISTPTLRPDGSLLNNEGYDAATGLYLINPPPMPTINLHPTREGAGAALALLNG